MGVVLTHSPIDLYFVSALRIVLHSPIDLCFEEKEGTSILLALSVFPSVTSIFHHTFFPATMHHSQLKLGMVLWIGVLRIAYQIQVGQLSTSSIMTSDIPSITNIFCHTFLSNHTSQPLKTWYSALARDATCCLNSGPPIIYFLFMN